MTFDNQAIQTIKNLESYFGVKSKNYEPIHCKYTVGIEIEIKFRYFFPEIFQKYFADGTFFRDRTEEEQNKINKKIQDIEKTLLPKLEKTVELGIPKGADKYYEFAFNPVNDLSLIVKQIDILKQIDLIPNGSENSLHITIGGLKPTKDSYYILMILELLFLRKDRIIQGFSKNKEYSDTWAKKGRGGIYRKYGFDLVEQNDGYEMRTLIMYLETDIYFLFKTLNMLMENNECFKFLKDQLDKYGFPDENWESPRLKPEIWMNYYDKFNDLSNLMKKELCYIQKK